jgi:hypothetical protein
MTLIETLQYSLLTYFGTLWWHSVNNAFDLFLITNSTHIYQITMFRVQSTIWLGLLLARCAHMAHGARIRASFKTYKPISYPTIYMQATIRMISLWYNLKYLFLIPIFKCRFLWPIYFTQKQKVPPRLDLMKICTKHDTPSIITKTNSDDNQ